MSHIVIIIDRVPPPTMSALEQQATDACTATVRYPVPHDATDEEVGKAIRKLYKQVRELGS